MKSNCLGPIFAVISLTVIAIGVGVIFYFLGISTLLRRLTDNWIWGVIGGLSLVALLALIYYVVQIWFRKQG